MQPQFNVRITKNDLKKLQRMAPQRAARATLALAEAGVTYAKLLINESPETGREYQRGSVTHVASSPGEAPRSDTGTLINSIRVEPAGGSKQNLVAATEYAELLEFGTETLEARPFFGPTVVYLESIAGDVFDGFWEGK